MKFVLRVHSDDPTRGRYVCFHMFRKGPDWMLGHFAMWSAQFNSREEAQTCIDRWAASSHPLPAETTIEEYHGF